ncbi:MAG: aminotransferase class V-fold PLP-dependent enzyme [Candidatus Doudnabacteria bacterium]|nr:aminotransferase class V-fold PLP-dependent enzyme [Candidatus Doudnabacteria bacterium]
MKDFEYLDKSVLYFDSSCQTLRPQQVIDAMSQYYHEYNACGGRVKYDWGINVDEKILQTKEKVLKSLEKSRKDYVVAFTLNTTYGINLILSQLKSSVADQIITSEIEHNSVFLPAQTAGKRLGIPTRVLSRDDRGNLIYEKKDLEKSVVILNTTSNIDGRMLGNAGQICKDAHEQGGLVLFDAAQTFVHAPQILNKLDFDGLFFSAHKFYGPSLGVMVVKKSLIEKLEFSFIGGGTVDDVFEHDFVLATEDLASRLEPGLQSFAQIIGFGAALDWIAAFKPKESREVLSKSLFEQVSQLPVKLINKQASPVLGFYSEKIEAHRLAIFLSAQNAMARSGYFCCHYYLKNLKQYPPLLRISLGLHNSQEQVDSLSAILKSIFSKV